MLDLVELPRWKRAWRLGLVGVIALVGVAATRPQPPSRALPPPSEPERIVCVERAAPTPATPVELERRWLVGGSTFTSPAEVDEALGTRVAAWETFFYTGDAQPRLAIASEIHPSSEQRTYEFAQDEYGGIWLVGYTSREVRAARDTYTREIFLVPTGASFRGVR